MNFFSNKKILVTGGTGHLGSNLVHCLVQQMKVRPEDIRIFYLTGSPAGALKNIEGLDFFAGNVLNEKDVEAACKDMQLVFHTIGSTTFDPRQKKIQWLVNIEGTRNVLEAYRKSNSIEKLCYTSTVNTVAIPDPVGSIGNFENSDPYKNLPRLHSFTSREEVLKFTDFAHNNKNTGWEKKIGIGYYDSKLAAQELVNEYCKAHGLNIVSILPGTMFGAYDYLIGTGMYVLSLYHNKMPAALTGGLPLMHIADAAEGHLLAMEKAKHGTKYIITGAKEDNRYFKDMAAVVADVLQKKFPDKKFNTPKLVVPGWLATTGAFISEWFAKIFNQPMLLSRDAIRAGVYPQFYTYQNAESDLGYKPKRTFRQGIEDMVDYYEKENLLEVTERFIDKR